MRSASGGGKVCSPEHLFGLPDTFTAVKRCHASITAGDKPAAHFCSTAMRGAVMRLCSSRARECSGVIEMGFWAVRSAASSWSRPALSARRINKMLGAMLLYYSCCTESCAGAAQVTAGLSSDVEKRQYDSIVNRGLKIRCKL